MRALSTDLLNSYNNFTSPFDKQDQLIVLLKMERRAASGAPNRECAALSNASDLKNKNNINITIIMSRTNLTRTFYSPNDGVVEK